MTREEYLRYGLETELLKFSEYLELTKPLKLPEGLEEAATEFANQDCVTFTSRKKGFVAGAKWDRAKMMEGAVEGYVNYYEDSGGILMAEAQVGCPYHNGDKVKVIVIKEEK